MRICPKCQTENSETAAFCKNCGSQLTASNECPTCGAVNDVHAKYCENCGKLLMTDPAPAAVLLENDTYFTARTTKDYYRTFLISGIFGTVVGVLAAAAGIVLWILFFDFFNLFVVFLGLACVIMGIYCVLRYFALIGDPQIRQGNHQIYRFTAQRIDVEFYAAGEPATQGYLLYSSITKVRKKHNTLLIFFDKHLFFIDPQKFTTGSEGDFKKLLTEKCYPGTVKLPENNRYKR